MIRTAICFVALAAMGLLVQIEPAPAKGCIKGAIVGGVAGHYAGHHGKTGAAVGCVVGHHEATKHQREQSETNTPNR